MKKNSVGWLFAVIILSFLLILSVILGFSGYFFSVAYYNSPSDMVVGDNISIAVLPNQASVASLTFDGSYLPKENIPQTIQINAQDLNSEVRVRIKALVFGAGGETQFGFVTSTHFEKAEDGYYYYDGVLSGGNKITFCNYLVMTDDSEFKSSEKYILSFVVETLETKFYEQNVWENIQ